MSCKCIFAADLSAAQSPSILAHKNFRDSDWSANNPQVSSEPIGESCTVLGDMLLLEVIGTSSNHDGNGNENVTRQ